MSSKASRGAGISGVSASDGAVRKSAARSRRFMSCVGIIALLVSGTILGQPSDSAAAADYPSWADVQAARHSLSAKQAEIKRLDALLSNLESAVTAAQAVATKKGEEFQAAQQAADEAAYKAVKLDEQADAAKEQAELSQQRAGQLAAQLSRLGGGDLSTSLFFSDDASDLLSQLGLASVIKDRASAVYAKAEQDGNTARSMSSQASVAKEALKDLAAAAQKALDEANAATDKAADALAEQEKNKSRLEAQRSSLASASSATEASYKAGVAAAKKAAEEWAAAHPTPPAGQPSTSGWALPASGHISSNYGYRVNPVTHRYALHAGTDIAGGCNSPIRAAHAGTVSYAGWNGGYGNFILINHGGGLSTGYGHIVGGGIMVHVGQSVVAGQQIARIGSTGQSTGCHLHFETRPGGVAVDAVPFMAARGVRLG